jgi:hypothetical protein
LKFSEVSQLVIEPEKNIKSSLEARNAALTSFEVNLALIPTGTMLN